MENLEIYNKVRKVPDTAKREITAGRLKGKTDINPMWRIKTLTELCGAAGIGWRAEIVERWTDANPVTGEVIANIRILLHVNLDGAERVIEGIGGSMLIANESKGIFTDDEAWKKAYTDAISVACKALGIGADVYWDKDSTKYTQKTTENAPQRTKASSEGKDTTETTKTQQSEHTSQIKAQDTNDKILDARLKTLEALIADTDASIDAIINWAQKKTHKGLGIMTDEEFQSITDAITARKQEKA